MPQPGATSTPNTSAASSGTFNLPYPTTGGAFPPYPPPNNSFSNFPPYPPTGNVMPAANSMGGTGYPPYMNYPPAPGYNSGYVSRISYC